MAKINKKRAITQASGLPSKEQILTSPLNNDTLTASIESTDGTSQPARLTEGEFVISIPAIIGMGEGDYDLGLERFTQLHDELRQIGQAIMDEQGSGLSRVPFQG